MESDSNSLKVTDVIDDNSTATQLEREKSDFISILKNEITVSTQYNECIKMLVNELIKDLKVNDDINEDDNHVTVDVPIYITESDVTTKIDNDNGIDYIRFTNNGGVYSLPKRITNSLVGTFLYEQCQENQKTNDGNIFLDYRGDETLFPLLIDSLMNESINVDQLVLKDQLELLDSFKYCELLIPKELMKVHY
ncbi:hypothetical protein WA158_004699 [Blastocystis sp. Blastoise]